MRSGAFDKRAPSYITTTDSIARGEGVEPRQDIATPSEGLTMPRGTQIRTMRGTRPAAFRNKTPTPRGL